MLIGNVAAVAAAFHYDLNIGLVTTLALIGSLVTLFVLERVYPYRADWQPARKEWIRDFSLFGMAGMVDGMTKVGIALGLGMFMTPWDNGLPLWASIPIAVVAGDFFGYWLHRWGHLGWLWKVHGVHHTPDKVNAINNATVNFFNIVYGTVAKVAPLALLGFGEEALVAAAFIGTVQSFIVHVNADLDERGYADWILTPVHHRLHHSTIVSEAGNFATLLTVWDKAFGTYVYEPGREIAEAGVDDPESFPAPMEVLRNQLHPFIDQAQRDR